MKSTCTLTLSPFVLVTTFCFLIGCGSDFQEDSRGEDGKLDVVATTGMIADIASVIGGDRLRVVSLMGPGVDPHLYKATKGDVDQLEKADLILYNGLFLEGKMADVFESMGGRVPTIAVAESIDSALLRHAAEFQGHPDPHVWFDVALWSQVVARVGQELAVRDSVNAGFYQEQTSRYLDSLAVLDLWVKSEIQTIPQEHRVLVTAHDAFGYFGLAYGLEVRGLQGISTVTEAGLYDVTAMVDILVSRQVPAVFVESSVPRKAIEAVVEGCRDRGHEVRIGGELFSDAMGQAGTPEGTYLGMVRHNVRTITQALRGIYGAAH